jgi:hypothetical protein
VTARDWLTWAVLGTIGWAGLVWIGLQLYAGSPEQLGFDLELLLDGGRAVAAGRSPYDPAMLGGAAPAAPSLFYSYPPLMAQAMVPFAAVPSLVMLVALNALSVAGLAAVAEGLRRWLAPARSTSSVVVPVVALVPFVLPLAVGMLFGNLDVLFPALYGLLLLASISTDRLRQSLAGVALVVAAIKLHPASLGAWLLVRAVRHDAPGAPAARLALATAAVLGSIVIAASVLLFGFGPWREYLDVVRAGSGAELVDPRNVGIAAQIALVTGGGEGLARGMHVVVGVLAVLVTAWAAWSRRDPVESFAWAAAASLSTLPVTWYHYPSAMIPVAIGALLRAEEAALGRTRLLVLAAAIVGAVSIVLLPLLWLSAALVIAAARASAPGPSAASRRGSG